MRYIMKKYILPIKWKASEERKKRQMQLKDIEMVLQHMKEKELEYHQHVRKNSIVDSNVTKGYLQALNWVCQELNEYKTSTHIED